MPEAFEGTYGTRIELRDLIFPNGQEQLEDAIQHQRKIWNSKKQKWEDRFIPVSYRILARKNGAQHMSLYVQAMFEERTPEQTSDGRLGAIGLDLNVDHIAMGEIDHYGNPIGRSSFAFSMQDKSRGQVRSVLGDHIAEIVLHAKRTGKPIVCENLDFAKKKSALREQGGKAYRRVLSSFVYAKFHEMLTRRAKREGVKLKGVNPAFTSVIGFYKFSSYRNYSSHETAAISIARRGLRYSERPRRRSTPSEAASIRVFGEKRLFCKEKRVGHVWSIYAHYAKDIREAIRQSPPGRGAPAFFNPRRPSGYREIQARMRWDRELLRSHSP